MTHVLNMGFNKKEVAELLSRCHRRCCICHRFCGVKMELHHVMYKASGGGDDIANAIPLCFECHAEVNHYNDSHPRGRKFTEEELLAHKQLWLDICKNHPEALISAPRDADVGPLEGMSLELSNNCDVLKQITEGNSWQEKIGCVLYNQEYLRSVAQGSLLLLPASLRKILNEAYTNVGRVNTFVTMYSSTRPEGNAFSEVTNKLLEAYRKSKDTVINAEEALNLFLSEDKEKDLK